MKTLFFILSAFFMFAPIAQSAETALRYRAVGLNMPLLEAVINLKEDAEAYTINTRADAKGLLALFIHAQTIFETKGYMRGDSFVISESVMKTKDKKQIVRIPQNFADKEGYMDYQTLLLHLRRNQEKQTHSVLVSDGKRDMRITLLYEGQKELSVVYKGLSGLADKWSVRIEILSGKKKGWFFERMGQGKESPLSLYMQETADGLKELVLGVFDTGIIGELFIVKEG